MHYTATRGSCYVPLEIRGPWGDFEGNDAEQLERQFAV